ncbi:hypothetical protein KIN34_12650 [Cellulomonas sp. DKR-3]|uniref:Uncharacterized protein n=1 Tax=Cellulomonas fulva TaxID=2835530 RepID=A0ABS5U147_9CELL|nr:hypothetical protein [Cellulomonas fulva]MBT0995131.1 hypothetical protein [Cellulomonas fulva]
MRLRFRPAALAWLGVACVVVGIATSGLAQRLVMSGSAVAEVLTWMGGFGATVLNVVTFVPQLLGAVLIALAVAFRRSDAPHGSRGAAGSNTNTISTPLDN